MDLNLGIANVGLPAGFSPSAVVCSGQLDKTEAVSAGPTMAKSVGHEYRRVLAFSFAAAESAVTAELLSKGLEEIKQRAKAKQVSGADLEIGGKPAKLAQLSHLQGPTPVVTFVLLCAAGPTVCSALYTVLDSPKVVAEAKTQFDQVVQSFTPTGAQAGAPIVGQKPKKK